MNVLLINGSPHAHGCTDAALREVAAALNADGIETRIFHIGSAPVGGCIGCGGCASKGHCVFDDDVTNEMIAKIKEADGLVIGSPVYYSSPNGNLISMLADFFMREAISLFISRLLLWLRREEREPLLLLMICRNILRLNRCPLFPQLTGIWFTEAVRRMS